MYPEAEEPHLLAAISLGRQIIAAAPQLQFVGLLEHSIWYDSLAQQLQVGKVEESHGWGNAGNHSLLQKVEGCLALGDRWHHLRVEKVEEAHE